MRHPRRRKRRDHPNAARRWQVAKAMRKELRRYEREKAA